jgi:hypothetical protein
MKKYYAFLTALCVILLIGCTANLKDIPREKCATAPGDNIMKAINDNCIKCHEKDFSNKEGVCSLKSDIIEQVRTKKMPKIGTLWPEYYKTFMDWK